MKLSLGTANLFLKSEWRHNEIDWTFITLKQHWRRSVSFACNFQNWPGKPLICEFESYLYVHKSRKCASTYCYLPFRHDIFSFSSIHEGDTAQSIMRGVAFRFDDLKSLFHYASKSVKALGKESAVTVPKKVYQLTHNYRSHAGKSSSSVTEAFSHHYA